MTERGTITDAISEGKTHIGDVDSATRRRLQARYAATMDAIEAELRFILNQLEQFERTGRIIGPNRGYTLQGRLWRQQYLQGLLDLIEAEYARNAAHGAQDIAQAQREAVSTGRRQATEAVRNMGLEGGVGPALNTEAYERLVAATDPGSPVRQVMEGYGPGASYVVEQALIDGVIKGQGADPIIRTIRNQIGPGVPRWRIAALVRTETMRAFRGSLQESYKALGVEQVRWTAALGTRTCLACLSRHGDLFPVDYQMDAHVNCRCVLSPYTGLPTDRISGEEWLRRQPEAVQRAKLGEAYDAFQRGDVSLKDFAGVRRSRTWGDSIYERTPKQVMAGLPSAANGGISFTSRADARRWFEDRGIQPSFIDDDLEVFNTVAAAYQREIDAGRSVNDAIFFSRDGKGGPVAYYNWSSDLRPQNGEIFINMDSPFWTDPATRKRAADSGWFYDATPEGTISHEMGHWRHTQNITVDEDGTWKSPMGLPIPDSFPPPMRETAAKVSQYAATEPREFVAEVYSGMAKGDTFDDDVMRIYQLLGGPDA